MQNQSSHVYHKEAARALGGELRQIREKSGISVADVAQRLKLSEQQIEALEKGDYSSFAGVVFVMGFLRSYARMINMDTSEIEGRLQTVVPQESSHAYLVNRKEDGGFDYREGGKTAFPKWILALAALLLVGGGIYAWQNKSQTENNRQNEADSNAVQNSLQAPALQASNVTVSPMTEESSMEVAASDTLKQAAASEPVVPEVSVAADELWIKPHYRSRLVIRDNSGKLVFEGIVAAGSEHRERGGAPYEVWIGIAAEAQANFGGTPIDLKAYRREGRKSVSFRAGK
ncbi:helix-turn-helix domain-containing protein [Neisseria animalis]|uniref:Helix-turn-helix domain-containing protein n=1 Tax=Neisseria animalis TaxID=492 RepID=A0A5P3MNY9_NEIAN|nr:helix-turn-helix domain-containing protein [Neisseria animalis]QEY23246.1 helix-turn-helix domain-containing protein [Neisseria animalis]ROW31999.1 helix-turn-helix domain-containing protein [Neisseria animalis]VEE08484.1 Cytoskeleton protein rodZ [Neisseria animalis]